MGVLKLALIINPASGKGLTEKKKRQLFLFFNALPFSYQVYFTTKPKDYEGIKQFLDSDRFKIISVVGGDGTLNEVINSKIEIENYLWHLIPWGTGNDLSRMFDKYNWQDALLHKVEKTVDYWLLDDVLFINALGFGFDGTVASDTHRDFIFPWPNAWKYHLSILKNIFGYKEFKVVLHSENQKLYSGTAFMITLANGAFFGNGFHIAPSAEIDDKILDIYVIEKISSLRRIMNLLKARQGKHTRLSEVKLFRKENVLMSFSSNVLGQKDGELFSSSGSSVQYGGQICFLTN